MNEGAIEVRVVESPELDILALPGRLIGQVGTER